MKPIETLSLFEDLNQELIYFLADLQPNEWLLPSPINGRTVKDLASHLVDGSLRRISMQRDHFFEQSENDLSYLPDLINHVQTLNQQWIIATRRLSPRILVEILKKYEQEVFELYSRLKSDDEALFPVAWAYQDRSLNWFDIARDYTEKWHHQMQMRMAVNQPLLMSERFLTPVYETFLLALPAHLDRKASDYRDHLLEVEITGEIRMRFSFINKSSQWSSIENNNVNFDTRITIPASVGWILFTNTDLEKEKYIHQITITGNQELAMAVLSLTTVLS
ncbi:MAG: hypothetical protein CVT92_04110 [Bacteroidetes bacterium HGW-Bacteroidetes-1]|jgi:hypothetical protein|nr:MAG: hypothetical protein CVT92_04110 [Bacteroidetes bacterium HGW-Bacteroidetes-1]